jgi:hypothetical protein
MNKLLALTLVFLTSPAFAQFEYGMPPWPGPRPFGYPMGPPQRYDRSPLSRPPQYRSGPRPFYDDGSRRYLPPPDFGPPGFDRRFVYPPPPPWWE